jgi:hypothetical protein
VSTKSRLKPIIVLTLIIVTCLLVSSCKCNRIFPGDGNGHNHNGYIIGSGIVAVESRDVAFFRGIIMKCSGEVFFTKESPQMLRIEVDDNIIDHIKTTVGSDGMLFIESDVDYSSIHGVKVYASMEEVNKFSIEGSAKIKSESPFSTNSLDILITGSGEVDMDVDAQNIISTIEGSGDITLRGRAFSHIFSSTGDGSLDALDLEVNVYEISIVGACTCWVQVTEQLEVTIIGAGIVYYSGNPSVINANITGGGRVIKL